MLGIPSISIFSRHRKEEQPVKTESKRKVIKVYRDEKLVGTYNDVDTACKILKLNKSSVLMCIKGRQKLHKGYEFKEEEI